jgi:hypothetical protein
MSFVRSLVSVVLFHWFLIKLEKYNKLYLSSNGPQLVSGRINK